MAEDLWPVAIAPGEPAGQGLARLFGRRQARGVGSRDLRLRVQSVMDPASKSASSHSSRLTSMLRPWLSP